MASFITVADIITAAVEIERRGHAFYNHASMNALEVEDKDFFTFMAKEELRHEKNFKKMLERTGGLELPAGTSDAEYLEYVHLLLNSHEMFLPEQQRNAATHPLNTAISFEKDTILFFTAMRRLVPDAEHAQIDLCITEEEKHLRLIAEYTKARAMAKKNA